MAVELARTSTTLSPVDSYGSIKKPSRVYTRITQHRHKDRHNSEGSMHHISLRDSIGDGSDGLEYDDEALVMIRRSATQRITDNGRRQLRKFRTNLMGGQFWDTSDTQFMAGGHLHEPQQQNITDPELRLQRLDEISDGVVDELLENQRGWFFFGYPLFSSNSLMPLLDYAAWTTPDNKEVFGDTSSYMLPDLTWKWKWKRWYVDMANDVDDQGWEYSMRFGSKSWHGAHMWFHSFVRRRKWIRLRDKRSAEEMKCRWGNSQVSFDVRQASTNINNNGGEGSVGAEVPTDVSELIVGLQRCRLDRERIDMVCRFVQSDPEEKVVDALLRYVDDEVMGMFQFADSKRHLLERLDLINETESHYALEEIIHLIRMHINQRSNYRHGEWEVSIH